MSIDTTEKCVSIPQWYELSKQGIVLPISITLDGDSMRPLVRRKLDKVTIVPLSRSLIRGDVVLFEHPAGRYVVHRIYRLKGDTVQTLGDNCMNPDSVMPLSCVLGQITCAERNNHTIPLDTSVSRAFGRVWMACLPMRRLWRKSKALAVRILRKMKLRK
jgi:hypothetical protein